jgi:glutamate-ammonia-ligase adenylyltransferase
VRLKKVSKDFEKYLAEISAGVITSADFEKLVNLIESEIIKYYFTASSEANLIRIIQATYDKISFIKDCFKYPHYIEILITIAANSNYLTDILVINPEYFYWVVNPSILKLKLNRTNFSKELRTVLTAYNSLQTKVLALKSIKRKELLRIGLKDIYLSAPLIELINELSILAAQLSVELFTICYQEIINKYNLPKPGGKYCLVALGKLGGDELNYSSDIDLILFYDKERKLNRHKYFSEILIETTQLFLKSSAEITGGFLYRIDFRLRPDGKSSPLCRSMQEYLDYYESRGEDWERQMLIKAAFLCGSNSLYSKFINYLLPFIFPSSFSVSPKKQILNIKENIERQIKEEENIKLSYGGIRDIEFSVQALQMLNGGRNENLQIGDTLSAIEALNQANYITKDEAKTLTSSYIFYRQIEHYLQLMNNRQTHLIPAEGELLEKMSTHLGFKDVNSFNKVVTKSRKDVRKIYDSIFIEEDDSYLISYNLDEIGFEDKKKALRELQFLKKGKGIIGTKTFDSKSVKGFLQIENMFIDYLNNSDNPDRILSNFVRIIKQADLPTIWFSELRDETYFNLILELCEYSQYSVDLFAEDQELREFILNKKAFIKIPTKELIEYELKYTLLYLSAQLTVGLLNSATVMKMLSIVIHGKIKSLFETYSTKQKWNKDYFVAALGSLGSSTITFYSDLDLLFIVKDLKKYDKIENHFQELLALLRQNLKPFTVDCRLRPEGESSQLVWDIEDSKSYFNKRARVWEFQALTKISFVCGNKRLYNSLTKTASSCVSRFNRKQISDELKEMHKKITEPTITAPVDLFNIKKNSGGLIDIEFIIHSVILNNAELFDEAMGKSFREQIELSSVKKLNVSEKKELLIAFDFLKSIQLFNQSILTITSSKVILDVTKLRPIVSKMNYENSDKFRAALNLHTSNVRRIFSKLVK